MSGRLIAVIGPSGVGKDSVIAAMARARPSIHVVRRVITRAPDAGGEPFEPVSRATFARRLTGGQFALSWEAHGLMYGIPVGLGTILSEGQDALVNLSRRVLREAAARYPSMMILALTAPPEILAARLADRGRETAADIACRLGRRAPPVPDAVRVVTVANDGRLSATVEAALGALYPVSAMREI